MEREKRECILVAAAKAFARHGFRKASVDEIARAAGVAKGTVYLACASKEDLFYQVLHREVRAWVAEVAKVIDPRSPADQLLALASMAGVDYLEKRPLLRVLLFGEAHVLLPDWTDRLDQLSRVGLENVTEILRLGIKQGLFRADLDVEEVAILLTDLQLAFFILHDRGPDRAATMDRRRMAGFDLVLNGIRARSEPPALPG